jgi:hypothetical protein
VLGMNLCKFLYRSCDRRYRRREGSGAYTMPPGNLVSSFNIPDLRAASIGTCFLFPRVILLAKLGG